MKTVGSHTQNTSLSSAATIAVPPRATYMMAQAQTQNVRLRFDGTAPTATVGFLLTAGGEPVLIPVPSNGQVKAIETTASAKLDYQFLGS